MSIKIVSILGTRPEAIKMVPVIRELSPAHVHLARRPGGAPIAKITDFGTAKLMRDAAAPAGNSSLTEYRDWVGSPKHPDVPTAPVYTHESSCGRITQRSLTSSRSKLSSSRFPIGCQ